MSKWSTVDVCSFMTSHHAFLFEDAAALLMAVSLVRLTAYPRVSNLMSELYDDDPPDEVPDFEGNVGDLVAVTALKIAGDRLTTSQVTRLASAHAVVTVIRRNL